MKIENLQDYQYQGHFVFQIPGESELIYSSAKRVEAKPNGDFAWQGSVEDDLGTVIMMSRNSELFGHISVSDRKWELWPIGDELYALAELDFSRIGELECGSVESVTKEDVGVGQEAGRYYNCSQHARILVLYTSAAASSVPDIEATANMAVWQMNTALQYSGILGDGYVRAAIAGPLELNFTETSNINTDLATLSGDSTVQGLRNTYGAIWWFY